MTVAGMPCASSRMENKTARHGEHERFPSSRSLCSGPRGSAPHTHNSVGKNSRSGGSGKEREGREGEWVGSLVTTTMVTFLANHRGSQVGSVSCSVSPGRWYSEAYLLLQPNAHPNDTRSTCRGRAEERRPRLRPARRPRLSHRPLPPQQLLPTSKPLPCRLLPSRLLKPLPT